MNKTTYWRSARELSVRVIVLVAFTCRAFSAELPDTSQWEALIKGKNAEIHTEAPIQVRGKYALLQVGKNDDPWKDVSSYNILWMTINAKSATEHFNNVASEIRKSATTHDEKGDLVVYLLLSDATILIIDLWDAEHNLALVYGRQIAPDGTVNVLKMRCWIKKDL